MLENLSIRNIGGISSCDLSFNAGLTVITGESGAGKSSIVRSIELLIGKRCQSSLIRAGENEASVNAIFNSDLLPDLLSGAFSEQNLQQDLPQDLLQNLKTSEGVYFASRILSRNTSANGSNKQGVRGRAMLQSVQIPANIYSAATARMIHIQSQFAQLDLLDSGRQLAIVDSCGGEALNADLQKLREIFENARLKEIEIKNITSHRAEIERRYSNASEIIPLVKKVNLKVNIAKGLESSLEKNIAEITRKISDGAKISQYIDRLTGGLSEHGLLTELENICKALYDSVYTPDCVSEQVLSEQVLSESKKLLHNLLHNGLQNFEDFVGVINEHTEYSPAALSALSIECENLEQRLGSLRKLRRLSGTKNEEDLLEYCQNAEIELAWLENSYDFLEKASSEARELRKQASQLAMNIREARKTAAAALEIRVNAILADLAMAETSFAINFTELPKLRRNGADLVEFSLCTNKGSPTERSGKVEKIASGGELSRLLLALQLSLSDEWLPPTLVFDEVEAGLGGKAAVLSGLKLKELSRKCQVILITHEASIAALGDNHYVIQKETQKNNKEFLAAANAANASAVNVNGEERVREIARMLSGDPALPEAQEHARRLLCP